MKKSSLLGGVKKEIITEYKYFNKDLNLTIGETDKQLPFNEQKYPNKDVVTFNELSNFLKIFQFITFYWDPIEIPKPKIIHVTNLTQNHHIYLLSLLYPNFEYHLYGIHNYDFNQSDIIKIYNKEFDENDAKKWSQRNDIFFISTKRAIALDDKEKEQINIDNLLIQEEWLKIINPVKALITLRLPYNYEWQKKELNYLEGLLYINCWTEENNTELSLIPDSYYKKFNYNIKLYEYLIFYHRKIVRQEYKFYNIFNNEKKPISVSLGLYNDYDSIVTTYIVTEYLVKHSVEPTENKTLALLKFILENVQQGTSLFQKRIEIFQDKI